MDNDIKEVRVADMYFECEYAIMSRPSAVTARCLRMAKTAVEFPDGTSSWRCDMHSGMTQGFDLGPISKTMFTTRQIPEKFVLSRLPR